MQKGDLVAATRELEEALRLSGSDPYIAGVLGMRGREQGTRRLPARFFNNCRNVPSNTTFRLSVWP